MRESVLILAERYAKAVLRLAVDDGAVDTVGHELTALAEACFDHPQALAFWRSSKVPADEKRNTLQDILEQMDAHALVRNTANLLADRGRFELLSELVAAYQRQASNRAGLVDATVTSAAELPADALEKVRHGLEQLTGRTVRLEAEVDAELIGGLRVRVGNTIIDGSARGRLRAMARRFA